MSGEQAFLMAVGAYIGVSIASTMNDLSYERRRSIDAIWSDDRAHARRRALLLSVMMSMKIFALLFVAYIAFLLQTI